LDEKMKNEFTVKKLQDATVYTLESATSGGTSAGSVASVSGSIGGVRRRGDNLIAQEEKKEAPKPRNFVAKNAKMGGAGQHKDKKKEQKQGVEKHKKPYMEDHEVSMASNELKSIHSDAKKLLMLVQRYGENGNLEAWQQSKITKAADYLNSVLQSIGGEQGVAEGAVKELSSDLKTMSDEEFQSRYKMSKADARANLKKKDEGSYYESLSNKLAEKLNPNAPTDVWVKDFQKADPSKYRQFKNKTPAKKAQMAVAAHYAANEPSKKK
jgi:hypothetical protein